MTTVTDEDIKKLERLILGLGDRFTQIENKIDINNIKIEELEKRVTESNINLDKRLTESISSLDKRLIESISSLDKRLTESIINSDKRLIESISSLDKRLTESISSLENNLDKRLSNQEFIFRAVIVGIVVSVVGGVFKLLWQYPFS